MCGLAEIRNKHLQIGVCGTVYCQNGDRASFNVQTETDLTFCGFPEVDTLFSNTMFKQSRNSF